MVRALQWGGVGQQSMLITDFSKFVGGSETVVASDHGRTL